jgi:hypothetical protein
MFRDDKTSATSFMIKFEQLKKKLDERIEVHLDSEYHQQLKDYIVRLYTQTCLLEEFSEKSFVDIKDAEMSNLNRLQKLKNGTSYKKDKHKAKRENEDWG